MNELPIKLFFSRSPPLFFAVGHNFKSDRLFCLEVNAIISRSILVDRPLINLLNFLKFCSVNHREKKDGCQCAASCLVRITYILVSSVIRNRGKTTPAVYVPAKCLKIVAINLIHRILVNNFSVADYMRRALMEAQRFKHIGLIKNNQVS